MPRPNAKKIASRWAQLSLQPDYGYHPCQHGGECQCGGGCGCSGKSEDDLHPEGENYMSVQALAAMQEHAAELLEKVNTKTRLPDWVEAKLTEANSKLTDVYEYMAHGHGKTL